MHTEFLDDALDRLMTNASLRSRADALMEGVKREEPLFAESLRTPQSAPYHGEGPYMDSHVRRMLMVLFALVDGEMSLMDLEEFRRLKGYEGEIQELENTMKAHAGFFEVYCLSHDAAKWSTIFFESKEGSRGAALGIAMKDMDKRHAIGDSERAKYRERYIDLYEEFAADFSGEADQVVQEKFFAAYGIRVRYPGHDRAMHAPVYNDYLRRLAAAHRLSDLDIRKLEDMIAVHLDVGHDFAQFNPGAMKRYYRLAQSHGYDSDEFIDLLMGALFLDFVCGSSHVSAHGLWHDPTPLLNFFQSEHGYEPEKREEKRVAREDRQARARNQLFRKAGLDGVALMELFQMEPGPKFGRALTVVHAAIIGEGELPKFPTKKIEKEMEKRIARYREMA